MTLYYHSLHEDTIHLTEGQRHWEVAHLLANNAGVGSINPGEGEPYTVTLEPTRLGTKVVANGKAVGYIYTEEEHRNLEGAE